jgi:O-antigen chain-terminating methyltransferase
MGFGKVTGEYGGSAMRLLNILKCLYRLPEIRETTKKHHERLERTEDQTKALGAYASAVTLDRIEPLEAELKIIRERLNDIATQGNFPDEYYVDLEDLFRGSQDEIEARLQPYLPLIEGNAGLPKDKPAIDLGCGRGEWLDLLSRHSFETVGVDLNPQFISDCASRGHLMHDGNALQYLVSCEDESSSIVSAFHLIEHLPNRVLVDLVGQAFRVLAPGGMLIFESPNPENIAVSSDSFYLDPTHIVPRHPLTMHFLVKRCGFSSVEILRLKDRRLDPVTPFDALEQQLEDEGAKQATRYLREKFFAAPDYAIVAVKP